MGLFRFACYNLLSRKTRSGLALMGLTVAIAGMVGLFSVVSGLRRMTDETFGRLKGISVLQPGAPIPLFSKLPADWGREIAGLSGVRQISPELWQRANVIEGKMTISPPRFLFGVERIEHREQLGDAQEIGQSPGEVHELHAAAGLRHGGIRADELSETGAVDVRDVRHVDQNVAVSLVYQAVYLVLEELISLGEGNLAAEIQYCHVTGRAFRDLHKRLLRDNGDSVGGGY